MTDTPRPADPAEVRDLLDALHQHRDLFLRTLEGLDDEQIRQRTTVSQLCLGGILKHVTRVERRWADFIVVGAEAIGGMDEAAFKAHAESFHVLEGETLKGLLEDFADTATRTDQLVSSLDSLDVSHPLPEAPWFEPGATWSARRVVVHMLAELAQHAGHADIIREALDGQKTMG